MRVPLQPITEMAPDRQEPSVPAISVLMAVRNGERYLDEAVASILSQSFSDLELIVVDNGSSDRTPTMLAVWAAKDQRVRVFRFDRPGLARSLNHAAQWARATMLARLDADDIAEPDRLRRQYAVMMAEETLGAIGTNAVLIDQRGRVIGELRRPAGRKAVRDYLAADNPFVHSSMMFRRSLFEQVGGYRDGLRATEDFDLWLRMAEVSDLDLLDEPLVRYRRHSRSMVHRQGVRIALAAIAARAADHARRSGQEEPFVSGRLQLRRALPLLGLDRQAFRKSFRDLNRRGDLELFYDRLPLPRGLKSILRRSIVAIGLKPLYGWILARYWQLRR